ncbi:hypothetical protein L1049_014483 [Liquidambar formosana]|uniref:NB-ARC domain-containing protein n=1 Tax=Liquidambar formosana TaxID=63359 RepID=A0AAP0X5G1_LIQFO
MEFVQAVLTSIEILKNIWSCNMGECLNYKRILDENIETLKRKMEELRSREEDIDAELTKAQHLGGKKRKKEVETWLKNVQHKKREVHQHIEQKVGQRRYFSRSWFLRIVEKNTREVAELIEKGRFSEGLLTDVHEDQEAVLLATPLVGQSVKERYLSKIRECLKNDDIASIGVYGMGGIGKTTIVTHIHDELFQSPRTFDHVYWVTVSQESYIQKLQDNIAKVLGLTFSYPKDDIKRRAELMKDLGKKKRFILFLDDMWKAFSPEQVGILVGVNAGKLVVTTRSLDVCRGMDCQHNIKVEPLLVEEAWDLFMEKLGPETRLTPKVEEIAKSISKECAGLPLAIITTARSMRGVHNIHEWRNALKELREPSKGLIDMESEVFKPLKFSYDRLNDETLQQCLLYCALFPEDHQIQREYLIMCWLAEGLINEMKTRQAEFDRGHSLLNKLENACLLERTTVGNGEICVKMHDVIRDMALNLTMVNPQFMVKAAVQLTELPNERDWSENLERVSLMKNDIRGQLSCISPKCPRLSTLMMQFNNRIQEIPNSLFEHMQNLRVLDLSQIHYIRCLPESTPTWRISERYYSATVPS